MNRSGVLVLATRNVRSVRQVLNKGCDRCAPCHHPMKGAPGSPHWSVGASPGSPIQWKRPGGSMQGGCIRSASKLNGRRNLDLSEGLRPCGPEWRQLGASLESEAECRSLQSFDVLVDSLSSSIGRQAGRRLRAMCGDGLGVQRYTAGVSEVSAAHNSLSRAHQNPFEVSMSLKIEDWTAKRYRHFPLFGPIFKDHRISTDGSFHLVSQIVVYVPMCQRKSRY